MPSWSSQLQDQATNHAHARQCGTGNWLLLSEKASSLPKRQGDRDAWLPSTGPPSQHIYLHGQPLNPSQTAQYCSYQVAFSIVPKSQTSCSRLRNNITNTSQLYRLPRAGLCSTVLLRISSPGTGHHHLRHCWPPYSPAQWPQLPNSWLPPSFGSIPCRFLGNASYFIFLLWFRFDVSRVFPLRYSIYASQVPVPL